MVLYMLICIHFLNLHRTHVWYIYIYIQYIYIYLLPLSKVVPVVVQSGDCLGERRLPNGAWKVDGSRARELGLEDREAGAKQRQ